MDDAVDDRQAEADSAVVGTYAFGAAERAPARNVRSTDEVDEIMRG
jgi:hypothetical protein